VLFINSIKYVLVSNRRNRRDIQNRTTLRVSIFFEKFKNSLKKCVDLYMKRMGLEQNDIYLLDKNGKTIYFNTLNEINYDSSKFYIFNKTFYKEQLVKIFEENCDKIVNQFSNINFLPSNLMSSVNMLYNETNLNSLEKTPIAGINVLELRKIYETLVESLEDCKLSYKNFKINSKICEKIRDNYNYQFNSLEGIFKNISNLYE
jgi:hypothetical protein